jgi:xanthine dehydrogenase iron-sulfur cluster and FAD-binding subunit A
VGDEAASRHHAGYLHRQSGRPEIDLGSEGVITIGAGVTTPKPRRCPHPGAGPLIDRIGGEQVRNMGTIGGNIANGSPIGDTPRR